MKAVLRRLGYPPKIEELKGQVKRLFEKEMRKAPALLEPKGVYRPLRIDSNKGGVLTFRDSPFTICSSQVAQMLRESDPVVLFMVTIGSALEDEVKKRFDAEEMAEAVILDAIGSETADVVADRMHRVVLKKLAEEQGFSVTPRFSPGYGDWPVTVQGEFLDVCSGELIGISVNESSLMLPRKSVSAVLGWVRK